MSHLHFAATEVYASRIIQMGEARDRVFVSGAPSLDNLKSLDWVAHEQLEGIIGMALVPAPILVTFHPVTLEYAETGRHIDEVMAAIEDSGLPAVFTYPNADTHGHVIIAAIEKYVATHANARSVPSLGTDGYFSLMRLATAMVGNSSSGIIEAASFRLPVVDIGNRQRGRMRAANVIHAETDRGSILSALRRATSAGFRDSLGELANPYGDGCAAERVVAVLRTFQSDSALIEKHFNVLGVG